jgi:hypothetical protein
MFDDERKDCHRHCQCYTEGDSCCECDEEANPMEPIPVGEFFADEGQILEDRAEEPLELLQLPPLNDEDFNI